MAGLNPEDVADLNPGAEEDLNPGAVEDLNPGAVEGLSPGDVAALRAVAEAAAASKVEDAEAALKAGAVADLTEVDEEPHQHLVTALEELHPSEWEDPLLTMTQHPSVAVMKGLKEATAMVLLPG